MRNHKSKLILLSIGLALLSLLLLPSQKANAAYDGAYLISDTVFLHSRSMTRDDVQNFLSSKGSGIAGRSFYLNCYGANSKERQWYTAVGAPCDQTVPASHIIYYAAQIYGVNPRVVLATLQKEQSLITSPNPTDRQIAQAMGYACPTTGSCSDTSNFFYQIDSGVWVLRYHYERANGNNTWWNTSTSWVCGTEKEFYKPNLYPRQDVRFYDESGVHYRTHYIVNAATSSLYCYTPHAYNNPQGLYDRPPFGTTGQYYSGSYNFVYWFERWFGSVYGLDYDWNYEGISFSNGSSSVKGGSQVTVTVSAKNIGSQSWSNTNFPVRLGTFKPTNHASALYDSTWVSPYRLATLNESVVLPGEVGTFTFKINVPNRADELYIEHFNLVAEGAAWMPHRDFSIQLNITKQVYAWKMVSQTSSNGFSLIPGSTSTFTLVAKNTGNVTWTNTGNPVRLATFVPTNRNSGFYDNSWVSQSRPAVLQESTVLPGQNGTFVFTVKAPQSPGLYYERFNLVMEGISWFEDPWMEFQVNVGSFYKWKMLSQSSSTGSFVIPRNTTATFTLEAKNTGNVTWSNSTSPVRLATFAPTNRNSPFYHSSWISPSRPTVLHTSTPTVAPGSTGKFEFTVTTPPTAGFFVERFNLVSEGVSWFEDPWMEFNIQVVNP